VDALGIDIGSTNVKVVLVRDDGATLGAAQRPLVWERHGDVAEQDAVALWDAVQGALRDLASAAGSSVMGRVGAVGLCGQYSSIVPVDADAQPLAPMRLYLDQRGTPHCYDVLGRHEEAFTTWLERHPIPPVGGGLALGHILAFQLDESDIHERTAVYLEPVDYVAARLTGVLAATQGSMFASQLIDNRTLGATAYDPDLVAMAGIDPDRLPRLVSVGDAIGTVLPDLAAEIGIGAEVPVLTGITDSCGQALATGADRPGRVGIAIGTTGVILSGVDALGVDLDHEVLAMPGVRTDRYLVSAENGIAGRAVEHVLDHLIHASDALGSHGVADPFDGFDEALASSPAGARGVRFLPWLSGSLSPQAAASAGSRSTPGGSIWCGRRPRGSRTTCAGSSSRWRCSPVRPPRRSCSPGERRARPGGRRSWPTSCNDRCAPCASPATPAPGPLQAGPSTSSGRPTPIGSVSTAPSTPTRTPQTFTPTRSRSSPQPSTPSGR